MASTSGVRVRTRGITNMYVYSDSESSPDFSESEDNYEPSSDSEENVSNCSDRHSDIEIAAHNIEDNASNVNVDWDEIGVSLQSNFPFTGSNGLSQDMLSLNNPTPYDVYRQFLTDEILELMVTETNRYANQKLTIQPQSKHARVNNWIPTNVSEMKKFIGLLLYMGLVRMPKIQCYWSRNTVFYNKVCSATMSRNRFELLLRMWHFADNSIAQKGDRACKYKTLLEALLNRFQHVRNPNTVIAVDESMIPFRGRLGFRQYIPGKSHKYGIKLFKLCDPSGYCYNMILYSGKNTAEISNYGLSTQIVLDLSEKYLDDGRLLYADNFYSSVTLAKLLLQRKTHYSGTLRINRKHNPKQVTSKRLQKGEVARKINPDGIVVLKWKDKRDVTMISTCEPGDIVSTGEKE